MAKSRDDVRQSLDAVGQECQRLVIPPLPEWTTELPDSSNLGVKDIAKWLGVSTSGVRQRIKRGRFPLPTFTVMNNTHYWNVGGLRNLFKQLSETSK